MVGEQESARALHVFGVGVKTVGEAGLPDFVIRPAVAEDVHVAGEFEGAQEGNFTPVVRERVCRIEADNGAAGIVSKRIGEDVFRRNTEFRHHRLNNFAKPR